MVAGRVTWPVGIWGLAGVGVILRIVHFLRDPSIWHDEAALLLNVIAGSPLDVFGPLRHSEAAPPLFLTAERGIRELLGDEPWGFRLLPVVASCLAVLLVAWVARRMLMPGAALIAVSLFAFSDRLLWHACEAKPYAVDAFFGTLVVAGWTLTCQWQPGRRALLFAVAAPLLIWASFPGCFLCGGLLVALLPSVSRERRPSDILGYGLFAVTVGTAFLALALGPGREQKCNAMVSCWVRLMANWNEPWRVLPWSLTSATEALRYAFLPAGQFLAPVAIVGAVALWRRGERDAVVLMTVPFGLAWVAALMNAYPFGGARVMVYSAPALAVLVAAGVAPTAAWLGRRHALAPLLLAGVLLAPVGLAVGRLAIPWGRPDSASAAAYVVAHYQPGDILAYNTWEYEYHFRRLPEPQFYMHLGFPRPEPGERVWLLLSTEHRSDREAVIRALPSDWMIEEQREFHWTTVVRVRRTALGPLASLK